MWWHAGQLHDTRAALVVGLEDLVAFGARPAHLHRLDLEPANRSVKCDRPSWILRVELIPDPRAIGAPIVAAVLDLVRLPERERGAERIGHEHHGREVADSERR